MSAGPPIKKWQQLLLKFMLDAVFSNAHSGVFKGA